MPATLSIMGLYNYDNTLFDLMQVPDGIDKDSLVGNLVAELAENEVLYPNPIIMKSLIGIWSYKRVKVWNRLYKTTILDYDPISNYDRKEEWTDSHVINNTTANNQNETAEKTNNQNGTIEKTNNQNGTIEKTSKGTDSIDKTITVSRTGESTTTNSGNGTNINTRKVAGFDSDVTGTDYIDDATNTVSNTQSANDKSTETTTDKSTDTQSGTEKTTDTQNGTEKTTYGSIGTTTLNATDNLTRSGRAYGNIGVTTSQQMIMSEREVSEFDIYNYIITDFKQRFCLMVY